MINKILIRRERESVFGTTSFPESRRITTKRPFSLCPTRQTPNVLLLLLHSERNEECDVFTMICFISLANAFPRRKTRSGRSRHALRSGRYFI